MSAHAWQKTPRRLIYVDAAYTLKIVRSRHHEDYWHARHSRGYFDYVWGVHPSADIPDGEERRHIRVSRFSRRQISIEGTSRVLRLPKFLAPVNFLISQYMLFRHLVRHGRRSGIDAVFANDPLYCGLFGLALARRFKVPLLIFVPAEYDQIYAATGTLAFPTLFRFRRVEQAVMRAVFRRSNMVFAAAESVALLAKRYGAPEGTVFRLNHGKYIASFHLADPADRPPPTKALAVAKIPDAPIYLIYVGRHTELKHPDDALSAMKIVLDEEPGVIGVMAGEGHLMPGLKEQAKQLGIADRVCFPGLLDQCSLSLIMPKCVALSPLTGMALIEVALAGAPVVVYDRDWQSTFVQDGKSGFVVPFRDFTAMGEQALKIVRDPALRAKFSKAQRQLGLDFVNVEDNAAKERQALDAVFDRWARRGTIEKSQSERR